MKLRNTLMMTAGALAMAATAAFAEVDTNALVAQYQSQGYERIEVKVGPSQVKVEAIRGSTKVETIYDRTTGAVLKQETESVNAGDDTAPGVEFDMRDDDFLDDGDNDNDDNDNDNDDDDNDNDNDNDDNDNDNDDDDNGSVSDDDDDNSGKGRGRGRGRGGDNDDDDNN